MLQVTGSLTLSAPHAGMHDITGEVVEWLRAQQVRDGLLTLFIRHTSASLLIQENAAPAARRDVERYFARLAPENDGYEHDDEGPDDMPAHLRAALTQVHLSIPVIGGELQLGTWQGIYLFEHRRRPSPRAIAMHLIGE
ncbi:secondary thiamine-phosphate synthase enzyme YjbQ [Sphingomonas sp. BN140010]|uniref:Secondary thiamine-phosphate synthase enzyme YjbQ n=1 Tax=Sphingomonas arvum TaxID=2992113 RepID=A0ABT3JER5_9SPHN|nr:secondary thiamine-phosphate synthase enzyme YjbQ [Sphingomonas sp. BN140010]MCW3797544.1 secondary thiamine-phosphate synthase enzyme YjbQ [Sphingomonas sp. BN140010]